MCVWYVSKKPVQQAPSLNLVFSCTPNGFYFSRVFKVYVAVERKMMTTGELMPLQFSSLSCLVLCALFYIFSDCRRGWLWLGGCVCVCYKCVWESVNAIVLHGKVMCGTSVRANIIIIIIIIIAASQFDRSVFGKYVWNTKYSERRPSKP